MKVLIWVGVYFAATVIQGVMRILLEKLSVTDISKVFLSYSAVCCTIIIYVVAYFAGKKLCQKWDTRK